MNFGNNPFAQFSKLKDEEDKVDENENLQNIFS